MAGDWIKMKSALANEPEVRAIAKRTGLDLFGVVGRLHAVWAYADSVTECGEIPYLDESDIDKMVEHEGFADAMRHVGWLEVRDASIVIPAFETHNGKSAKRRSQTAKRNSEWRKKPDSTGTKRKRDAGGVTSASPREEKRREEKIVDAYASTPGASESIPFGGTTKNAHQFADELLSSVKWNPQRRGGDTGNRLLAKALVRLRDGARGQEASEDPGGWIGDRMVEYLESLSGPGFHPKFRGWIEEQYPDLVSEGEPLDAHR